MCETGCIDVFEDLRISCKSYLMYGSALYQLNFCILEHWGNIHIVFMTNRKTIFYEKDCTFHRAMGYTC